MSVTNERRGSDLLVRLLGWRGALLQADPSLVDRWRWLRRRLLPGRLRTLDAGSGSGALSLYATQIGNRTVALSFDSRNNEITQRRARLLGLQDLDVIQADLRELHRYAGQLGSFDQIVCFETIEHIRDDRKLVQDLASLLLPGGRLLMTTPYRYYRPLPGDTISGVEDGGHVRWGATHDELRQLFRAAGLETVDEDFVSGFVTQKLIGLGRRVEPFTGGRAAWAATLPFRALQLFDTILTRFTGYPYLCVAVVGVRRP